MTISKIFQSDILNDLITSNETGYRILLTANSN